MHVLYDVMPKTDTEEARLLLIRLKGHLRRP